MKYLLKLTRRQNEIPLYDLDNRITMWLFLTSVEGKIIHFTRSQLNLLIELGWKGLDHLPKKNIIEDK